MPDTVACSEKRVLCIRVLESIMTTIIFTIVVEEHMAIC